MTPDLPKLHKLLGGESLAILRERLAACVRRPRDPEHLFTIGRLLPNELALLCGLLGRPVPASGTLRTSNAALDAALAACGAAPSLRAALEALDGPWVDTRAERAASAAAWQAIWEDIRDTRLAASLATSAARGRLKALARNGPVDARLWLKQATQVIARLPANGMPLAQLAADTMGDAHGLDRGRPVARLVLNALMPAPDTSVTDDADESVRARWERLGVQAGELNRPVLLLNLACEAGAVAAQLVRAARDHGEPLHLSLRMLLRSPPAWQVREQRVFVCENPSIVAIAATRLGAHCAALVCTDGNPAAAQLALLQQLRDAGATLVYHGDFDWDGIRIANTMLRELSARPWRMAADDYIVQGGQPLSGAPVVAEWDAALAPKMQATGLALHEESAVEPLLADLETEGRKPL